MLNSTLPESADKVRLNHLLKKMQAQSTFEIQNKSASVNGQVQTKSLLVNHISCIDQDIRLESISVGKYAWQFSVYVFSHVFIVSSEAFDCNNEAAKLHNLKETQRVLKDLLKIWKQVNNKTSSTNTIPCPN